MHSGNLALKREARPPSKFGFVEGGSLVKSYNRHFEVVPADTPERLDESYRLRYHVYCVENAFEDPSEHPDEREIDSYNSHSVHSLLIHRASRFVTGTVKLVCPPPTRRSRSPRSVIIRRFANVSISRPKPPRRFPDLRERFHDWRMPINSAVARLTKMAPAIL